MPLSNLEKTLMGVGGVVGTGVLAWQTKFPWLKYDLQLIQVEKKMTRLREKFTAFLIDVFEETVMKQPKKTMIIYEDGVYTYQFMDQQANRVASVMRHVGLKCGDTVAMMIHNEPAFIWTLLGLMKLGVAVALININLRVKHLSRSVLAADPLLLIVGAGQDLQQAVSGAHQGLGHLPVYVQGVAVGQEVPGGMHNFDALMLQSLPIRPDRSVRTEMTNNSTVLYIYTSGTTGLPKPTYIKQSRLLAPFMLVGGNLKKDDVLYNCLPLYHAAGLYYGVNSLIFTGCTSVLKKKFFASQFWPDCRKYDVTFIVYIGEIFRYLLAQPPHDLDSVHKVRCAYGNGLRKDIHEKVLKRFKVPLVLDVFSATEGLTPFVNIVPKPGAVGRLSPFLNWMDPNLRALVQYDLTTAKPVRDKNGRCISIKPGETGLYICRLQEYRKENGSILLYKASKEANEKKLARNAFKEGDIYINAGDVFYLDYDYFVYFRDRIGDTFRWKGENVSTIDVANTMTSLDFIQDANVYGVTIPGHDGRAGMAALSLTKADRLSPEQLRKIFTLCQQDLPVYARPLFLRVLPEEVLTGTYKQHKVELREEGYDLSKVKDDLYYLDTRAATYSPLTPEGLTTFLHSKL